MYMVMATRATAIFPNHKLYKCFGGFVKFVWNRMSLWSFKFYPKLRFDSYC